MMAAGSGEVPTLPGVMAYGQTRAETFTAMQALALRAMADRLEYGEALPNRVPERLLHCCMSSGLPPALLVFFRPSSHRLDNQTNNRLSPGTGTGRLA